MSDMRRLMMMFTRPVDSGGGGEVEVPTPTILPASGNISPSQTISITISGIAVSAEYSTDNVNWITYTTPFTLSGNTTVYARAIDGDGNYSSVISNSYTVIYDSRVEYLQGTGNTTWINTNFIPTQNDLRVIIDTENTTNGDFIVWGIQGTNPRLNNDWYNKTRIYFRYRDYNKYFTTTSGRHTFETGPDMKIDGVIKATPTFSSSYTFVGNTKKIVLFGAPNAAEPTSVNYAFTGKVYEFWIYYGDELKLHFIPVRKDGIGYMYDTVSENLFGSSGTGTFTYGNDVTI